MAKYSNIKLTQKGLDIAINADKSKKLIYTHIGIGNGKLANNEDVLTLTAMKSRKIYADISDINNDTNNQVTLETVISNKVVNEGFYAREIGIYAKLGETGQEVLYGYANAGDEADYMPSKEQPIDELKLRITLIVGNVDNVTAIVNSSIIFITLADCRREIERHNADPLAHGDFARKKDYYTKPEVDAKLNGKANTSHGNHVPNLESANNARFLRNDNTWQTVTPSNIGAYHKSETYNKGEVNTVAEQKASTRVNKSGDTMTGNLKFAENNNTHDSIFPSHYFHNLYDGDTVYMHAFPSHPAVARATKFEFRTADGVQNKWTAHKLNSDGLTTPTLIFSSGGYIGNFKRDVGDAITDNGGANVNIGSWFGLGFYSTYSKKYTGTMDLRSGNWHTLGRMITNEGFHTMGDIGLVFSNRGGGWYMSDSTWIRAYGDKNIFTPGKMKADGGFEGKASSAGWADGAEYSNRAVRVENDYRNMRFHWSGQGGQPTWLWGGNDGENMYVYNPSNFTVSRANTSGRADTSGAADNAKNFDGRSLQNILGLIDAANTGAVEARLEENGYIKIRNGFMLQWGILKNIKIDQNNRNVSFTRRFNKCFNVLLTISQDTFISGANCPYVKRGSITQNGFTVIPDHSSEIVDADIFYVAIGV